MTVTLPDGTELKLEDGATGPDAARAIGEGLARAALGVRRNGSPTEDLSASLDDGDQIEIVTTRTPEDDRLGPLWRAPPAPAPGLAPACMELYPGVKISTGPPIENGFYYDFEFPEGVRLSEDD